MIARARQWRLRIFASEARNATSEGYSPIFSLMRCSMIRVGVVVTACAAALMITGCTSYYKVTDPTSGRVYYTTQLKQRGSGAAELTDARTGNVVNLQNSEVQQINKEEFEAGKYTAPAETKAKQGQ